MKVFVSFLVLTSFLMYNVYSREIDDSMDTTKKVICYFDSMATKRDHVDGKFLPEMIDTKLCTHIIYKYAVLDEKTFTMMVRDKDVDLDKKMYDKILDFKKLGKKVMIAFGGKKDSFMKKDKYGMILTDDTIRRKFIDSVFKFFDMYKFDGLDLVLEYPVCWGKKCDTTKTTEKDGFVLLVKDLKTEFMKRKLLLTAVFSGDKKIIDKAYKVVDLVKYLDFITLMTYDYWTYKDGKTGFIAPLKSMDDKNVDVTVKYMIKKGVDTTKLILGIPTYGLTFKLKDGEKHGLGDMVTGPGDKGMITKKVGKLGFFEICMKTKRDGFKIVRDITDKIGTYAFLNDQWVTFDDIDTLKIKTKYVKDMKLGGVMIKTLDMDDFKGKCGCGKFPMLNLLSKDLRGVGDVLDTKCV